GVDHRFDVAVQPRHRVDRAPQDRVTEVCDIAYCHVIQPRLRSPEGVPTLTNMQYIGYGSLKERAAAEIRSAIVRGDLEPGTAIKDVELAEKLGLSRTPVREALATLADEGLVETKPHAYTRVTALEAEPVLDALVVVQ